MAFTYVTLTRTYETADDLPATGTVTFTPVDQMVNGITIEASPNVATLDTAGSISKRLAATTDPATTPPGVTYQVVERLAGQPTRTYYVSVPHDQGSTLDLTTLTVITGSGGAAGFALRAATDYDDSVAPTDGQVMTWDSTSSKFHPEASAGGAVTSVNGSTGAVTVTPTGIGAQPVDSDLTAFAALAPADGSYLGRQSGAWAGRTTSQVKTDLALNNVDNTADTAKPISTATQTALDLKAPLASPTFTGTVAGPRFVGAVQTVTYATSITLDAAAASTFRVVATGNITTTTITNPTAGQTLYLLVQASGANRDVTVAGSTITVSSGTWKLFQLAYDAPTTTWVLETATTTGGGGTPDDGTVTNAKVAVGAAIDLDKTADSATRLAMTATERSTLSGLTERIQDDAAALFTGGVHTGISFAYNDASNGVDATVTAILASLIDAQGDLFVGTANDTVARMAAGTRGQVLTADPGATPGLSWGPGGGLVARNTVTTSYTAVLADLGRIIDVNSALATVVTIPPNVFPTDAVLDVRQLGAGQVTMAAGAGVTLDKPASLTTRVQYSRLSAHHLGSNRWIVDGDSS